MLIGKASIHLKILANALHHLKVDVIQGGSVFDDRGGGGAGASIKSFAAF